MISSGFSLQLVCRAKFSLHKSIGKNTSLESEKKKHLSNRLSTSLNISGSACIRLPHFVWWNPVWSHGRTGRKKASDSYVINEKTCRVTAAPTWHPAKEIIGFLSTFCSFRLRILYPKHQNIREMNGCGPNFAQTGSSRSSTCDWKKSEKYRNKE